MAKNKMHMNERKETKSESIKQRLCNPREFPELFHHTHTPHISTAAVVNKRNRKQQQLHSASCCTSLHASTHIKHKVAVYYREKTRGLTGGPQ